MSEDSPSPTSWPGTRSRNHCTVTLIIDSPLRAEHARVGGSDCCEGCRRRDVKTAEGGREERLAGAEVERRQRSHCWLLLLVGSVAELRHFRQPFSPAWPLKRSCKRLSAAASLMGEVLPPFAHLPSATPRSSGHLPPDRPRTNPVYIDFSLVRLHLPSLIVARRQMPLYRRDILTFLFIFLTMVDPWSKAFNDRRTSGIFLSRVNRWMNDR